MIDADLLIHTVQAYRCVGKNIDRVPSWDKNGTTLRRVRVVALKARSTGSTGETQQDKLALFFDCTVSEPYGFVLEIGQKIEWNEASYTVREVKPAYWLSDCVEFYRAGLV